MTANTATSEYWMNWRVLLCAIWVLISVIFALFLILKNEGCRSSRSRETQQNRAGLLYADEVWRPCITQIHPVSLLVFRVFAFFVLLALLVINVLVDGGGIFHFYTQWTFTAITIYFGLGSCLSMYGCYQHHNRVGGDGLDSAHGTYDPYNRFAHLTKSSGRRLEYSDRETAGFWAYIFQIMFQMIAGAVVLTDCVFWFIIVPFLEIKDYNLNFLIINMHSVNAVFLLGDTALNCLRFPWFRIGYFFLWTATYVVFQWIVHACISLWWPYPFLDLSSPWAPLWYLSVGLMHVPCYGIFALVMKLKHVLLKRWFPQTYLCML